MSNRQSYKPGAAFGAEVQKVGDSWTLVLVRTLRHPPAKVWQALTDPAQLREWAPFDSDRDLGTPGPVTLTTVGAPSTHVTVGTIRRAEAPRLLEFVWGGNEMRWELEPLLNGDTSGSAHPAPDASGTRLTLWHNIGRKFIAMGAAGWHICLDVLDQHLSGHALGRIVGGEAMQFEWPRLNAEYSKQFGIEQAVPPTAT